MSDQLSGTLWAHEKQASEHNRWYSADTDCSSPSLRTRPTDLCKSGANGRCDELTEGDRHIVLLTMAKLIQYHGMKERIRQLTKAIIRPRYLAGASSEM